MEPTKENKLKCLHCNGDFNQITVELCCLECARKGEYECTECNLTERLNWRTKDLSIIANENWCGKCAYGISKSPAQNQCLDCSDLLPESQKKRICEGCYHRRTNSCDVCRTIKSSHLIGSGTCPICKFLLDVCDNCIHLISEEKMQFICAKCRLCDWKIQPTNGPTLEWMQATLPNIKILNATQDF